MKRKINFLIRCLVAAATFASVASSPSSGFASMKACEQSFFQVRPMDRLSRATLNLVRILSAGNSTTGNRVEWKFVVEMADLQPRLDIMANTFGAAWKPRDDAPDGMWNVTKTLYMNKQKYRTWEGDERRVKVRARSYFTTDNKDTKFERAKRSPGFENKSWIEIKIQHPTVPRSVIKARVLVFDRYIQSFMTGRWTLERAHLIEMMKQLNPKMVHEEKELFDAIVEYFDASYQTAGRMKEGAFATTMYSRISRSVIIKLPDGTTTKFELTMDSNVQLVRLADGKVVVVYGPTQVIIEPKVGAQYAGLTPEILAAIPQLIPIRDLIVWAEGAHDKDLEANKGKLSKIRKIDPMARDRDLDDRDDEIFEDFGQD